MGETSFSVRTDDFVAALRSLKVHLKRRRNLDLLISHGAGTGELIIELSGNSMYSGMLTTAHGFGDWPNEVKVPVASVRSLLSCPPAAEKVQLSYESGRLTVENWSCPASIAAVQ